MPNKFNPFHLVNPSPWPLFAASGSLCIVLALLCFINKSTKMLLIPSVTLMIFVSYSWWRDISRESSSQGEHSSYVMEGLKIGMILFITSEVFFFLSFFWSYFHSGLAPTIELGQMWPPKGIVSFDPLSIPLLNTILLLSSGVSITWSHHSMMNSNIGKSKFSLLSTILLGVTFSWFQGFEYIQAPYSISDSSFGSTFFMATGFHGLHVIIGTIFLTVCLFRFSMLYMSSKHMVGFECAAWYWHFVDVVWLFLYISMYWWGSQ